jgi:gas vesicle protein
MKTKYLVLAAIGAAVILALRTEKGKAWSEDMLEDAKKWKKKLDEMAGDAGNQISDLKDKLSKEVAGLGSDARDRILAILDEGADKAKSAKKKLVKEL